MIKGLNVFHIAIGGFRGGYGGGGATLWLNILAEVLLLFFIILDFEHYTPPPSLSLHLAFELEHFLDPNLNNHPEFS